jgi:hypothetical protein
LQKTRPYTTCDSISLKKTVVPHRSPAEASAKAGGDTDRRRAATPIEGARRQQMILISVKSLPLSDPVQTGIFTRWNTKRALQTGLGLVLNTKVCS